MSSVFECFSFFIFFTLAGFAFEDMGYSVQGTYRFGLPLFKLLPQKEVNSQTEMQAGGIKPKIYFKL